MADKRLRRHVEGGLLSRQVRSDQGAHLALLPGVELLAGFLEALNHRLFQRLSV